MNLTCIPLLFSKNPQSARVAMQDAKVSPKIASLLKRIAMYPNIPRKKKKFEVSGLSSLKVVCARKLD